VSQPQIPKEKLAELQALQVQYEQLKALQTALAVELERVRRELQDAEVAEKELAELKEEKESLIPMGPVFVKATLKTKVLYPLGANVFLATSPEDAVKRLEERKKALQEEGKVLEAELGKVSQALASIEAKVAELYRGLNVAGQAQEGAKELGERSS